MANPPPMLPGLGFPVDSEIDLLRKWTWNTWLWAQEDFQPEDIPGLGLDLDASYGVLNSIGPDVPATNGQSVRRWLDKSGNGRDFGQATAIDQPTFLTAGFNGRPAVSCDGVNDYLAMSAGFGILRNVPGATIVLAVTVEAVGLPAAAFGVSTNSNSIRADVAATTTPAFRSSGRRLDSDPFQFVAGGVVDGSAKIVSGQLDYSAAVARLYQNGALVGTNPTFQTAGQTSDTDSLRVYLGASALSPVSNFSKVTAARVLVWPRALTAEELGKVHAYLSQTYGIPLAS